MLRGEVRPRRRDARIEIHRGNSFALAISTSPSRSTASAPFGVRWITTLRRSVSSRRRDDEFELAHRVERARDHRLGHFQLGGEAAHSVRRRLQINREQDGKLARG